MSERAISFHDLSEILKRNKFSLDNGIAVENFQSLIGPYHFPEEEAYCQVDRHGSRCKHRHHYGWLGRRNDGEEALIGRDCAIKYFNANTEFTMERKRVDQEVRIDSHVKALTELLQDKAALMNRVGMVLERVKSVRGRVRAVQDILTIDAKRRLNDMAKTGNRNVFVETRHVEKNEEGKEIIVWRQHGIGAIQGIIVWDGSVISEIYATLDSIKDTIEKARICDEEKEKNLQNWRETLEKLPRIEVSIAALEKGTVDFFTPDNATLLGLLGRAQTNRVKLCEIVLKANGMPNPSSKNINMLVEEMNERAKQLTGGKEYRGV
ncbi:MAG: hypothetical protein KGI81_04565 [Betaproteobacteria bacterium]|nr:hypothetical protein [Betaproteobacteria bacterium]